MQMVESVSQATGMLSGYRTIRMKVEDRLQRYGKAHLGSSRKLRASPQFWTKKVISCLPDRVVLNDDKGMIFERFPCSCDQS